jgi:trigger factor
VDEVLRKLQENNAEFIDAGDRGAILTDLIAIEETLVDADGNPLPGSKTQTQNINLGDSMILKEVNDALVGMKVGEEKVVVIERNPKKPEDGDTEGDDENAAKDDENKVEESAKPEVLYVKYKINEIKERRLPVLNDDFAKDMGEFESLEDLKKKIYEDLTAEEEKRADSEMKESLLEMLIKENPVEVPDPLLEIYSDRLIRREFDRHVGYGGKLENFPYDAVNEGVKDLAEKLAKWDLLKEALIKKESLKLTPEEIEAEIAAIAEKNGVSPSRVKLDLEKQKKKESFEDELQDNKVLDYLISVSEITER